MIVAGVLLDNGDMRCDGGDVVVASVLLDGGGN